MGLVQREVEAQGIPTVGFSIAREVSAQVRPPRTFFVRYPFGHPLGEPGNRAQQRRLLLDALDVLQTAREPGVIVDAPYPWRRHRFE